MALFFPEVARELANRGLKFRRTSAVTKQTGEWLPGPTNTFQHLPGPTEKRGSGDVPDREHGAGADLRFVSHEE